MSRLKIQVFLADRQNRVRISKPKFIRWVRKILETLHWEQIALSVALVNDSEMRRLNRRFLGEDRPTDVLAFEAGNTKLFPKPRIPLLGEVVVSVDAAQRLAPGWGHSWKEELLLYLCHGILHLMGYGDSTKRLKAQMDKIQDKVLQKILEKSRRKWPSKKPKPLF